MIVGRLFAWFWGKSLGGVKMKKSKSSGFMPKDKLGTKPSIKQLKLSPELERKKKRLEKIVKY